MRSFNFCTLSFVLLTCASAVAAEDSASPASEEATFELREMNVLQEGWEPYYRLTRGQYGSCSTEPNKAVKAYPKLKSKRPLYGKVKFDADVLNHSAKTEIEYQFVLDESGDKPNQKGKEETDSDSPNSENSKPSVGGDSKKDKPREISLQDAPLSRYDRLYFDINRDLDLTNDPVINPFRDVPWNIFPPWAAKEKAAFDYLDIPFDYGPEVGIRPLRILPWFSVDEMDTFMMYFVAVAAREGRIHLGKHKYEAILAQPFLVNGRFDRPNTMLYLKPVDPQDKLDQFGSSSEMLMALRRIDGQSYTIAASPLGDKLTVKPYQGDFGIFTVGPGNRDMRNIAIRGALRSKTVSIGFGPERSKGDEEKKIKECKVPVGDYLISHLSVTYGRLDLLFMENYHSDGKRMDEDLPPVYGVKIRKEKPFVLDFSHKPEILFTSPVKEQTVKPGEELKVSAGLIDPVLNIMIRCLNDNSRKRKETIKYEDGKEETYEVALSLDPLVTITNSAGKKVAEGVMPFG